MRLHVGGEESDREELTDKRNSIDGVEIRRRESEISRDTKKRRRLKKKKSIRKYGFNKKKNTKYEKQNQCFH